MTTSDGIPADAVAWAAEAVAHLVSLDEDSLVRALDPLQRLLEVTSGEIALLVVSQLCAGVTLGCADLMRLDPVRLVHDTAASMVDFGRD